MGNKVVPRLTDLALSLSYGIIEQHGETILVESEEGIGTTLTVKLPIKKDAVESPFQGE